MLREVAKIQVTEIQRAISQPVIGAFFFAMRSCEYLLVPQSEKRRTDILRLRNIRFFTEGIETSNNSTDLGFSDCVSITFEFQKKEERNDTVTLISQRMTCYVLSGAGLRLSGGLEVTQEQMMIRQSQQYGIMTGLNTYLQSK